MSTDVLVFKIKFYSGRKNPNIQTFLKANKHYCQCRIITLSCFIENNTEMNLRFSWEYPSVPVLSLIEVIEANRLTPAN